MPDSSADLEDVIELIRDMKHKKISGSQELALRTAKQMQVLISNDGWTNASDLMESIKKRIKCVSSSIPLESTACNVMRHVLKIIRDEFKLVLKEKLEGQSSAESGTFPLPDTIDYSEPLSNLRTPLLEHLAEYVVEIENSAFHMFRQGSTIIKNGDTIFTYGMSNTVESFLKAAAEKVKFDIVIAEGGSQCGGHQLAANLAEANIESTLIPDNSIFAFMNTVTTVILGAQSVLCDGGLRARAGSHLVCLAAKRYRVQVVVVSHLYKYTPLYYGSVEEEIFEGTNPTNILPYSSGTVLNNVELIRPMFDYVPPDLVFLFINHLGGYASDQIYHLLQELYYEDDYEI